MANTFSQIYFQYVFAVKGRQCLLDKTWRDEVFRYMSGIIESRGHKMIIANGMSDHVHILISFKPSGNPSELARDIKIRSAKFINQRGFIAEAFSWQLGYGIFSYSHAQKQQE